MSSIVGSHSIFRSASMPPPIELCNPDGDSTTSTNDVESTFFCRQKERKESALPRRSVMICHSKRDATVNGVVVGYVTVRNEFEKGSHC